MERWLEPSLGMVAAVWEHVASIYFHEEVVGDGSFSFVVHYVFARLNLRLDLLWARPCPSGLELLAFVRGWFGVD